MHGMTTTWIVITHIFRDKFPQIYLCSKHLMHGIPTATYQDESNR
jgi:hypothetical protein